MSEDGVWDAINELEFQIKALLHVVKRLAEEAGVSIDVEKLFEEKESELVDEYLATVFPDYKPKKAVKVVV